MFGRLAARVQQVEQLKCLCNSAGLLKPPLYRRRQPRRRLRPPPNWYHNAVEQGNLLGESSLGAVRQRARVPPKEYTRPWLVLRSNREG